MWSARHILQKDNTAQTAYITLCDEVINLEVTLIYTVFDEYDVIIRVPNLKIFPINQSELTEHTVRA